MSATQDPELGGVDPHSQHDEGPEYMHHLANVVRVVMVARNWLLSAQVSHELHDDHHNKRNLDDVFKIPAHTQPNNNGATTSLNHSNHKPAEPANSAAVAPDSQTSSGYCAAKPRWDWKETLRNTWRKAKALPADTVEPSKSPYYYWTFVVYVAFLYNSIMCVMFVFDDMQGPFFWWWIRCNFAFDLVYWADIAVNCRLNYVEDGIRVQGWKRLLKKYVKSSKFVCDLLSAFPTDFILFIDTKYSICRVNRLLKVYRVFDFVERTNIRTNYPNGFRIFHIVVTCAIIFHLNAALYFKISLITGIESTKIGAWQFNYVKNQDFLMSVCDMLDPDDPCGLNETEEQIENRRDILPQYVDYWAHHTELVQFSRFAKQYSLSIYWSSLTLTTSGQQPFPTATSHNLLEILDTISGVLVFAVIVGSVGNVVVTMNKARAEYQNLMDGIKFYMNYRQVAQDIQTRVMDCVGYINKNSTFENESEIMSAIPRRLQGELAVQLHMETLRRVELFRESEPTLLYEFVMKLNMEMYSPNDYLCRIGDVAKEMYIVKQGSLEVISATGAIVTTLREGDTFGELSLLKVSAKSKANRRQRSLRAVGYSDVYHLKQEDVVDVLRDYPEERQKLIQKSKELIRKSNKKADIGDVETLAQQLEGSSTVDESLQVLNRSIKVVEQDLQDLYSKFHVAASEHKKRVTKLETLYRSGHLMPNARLR